MISKRSNNTRRKVLNWLNKPENAELKETLVSTLPHTAKPEKQEQLLASQRQDGHQKPRHKNIATWEPGGDTPGSH